MTLRESRHGSDVCGTAGPGGGQPRDRTAPGGGPVRSPEEWTCPA